MSNAVRPAPTRRSSDAMQSARTTAIAACSCMAVGIGLGWSAANYSDEKPSTLCGAYRLDGDGMTGTYVLQADGKFSQQIVTHDVPPTYSGIMGRWWVHNPRTSYAAQYPPHDGTCIELEVTYASNPSLAGNQILRYDLHGQQLTTSSMGFHAGEPVAINTSRWLRL